MSSLFAKAPNVLRRVLIANRGEIACRVIQTCQRLGLKTIAVYSDVDETSLHVRLADEKIRIGEGPASQSYLNIDAIMQAVAASGADAVHPGYGFLSENAAFAERCERDGVLFIGPSSGSILSMGSKIEAKRIAEKAGVPTVPGYHGDDQTGDRLAAEAEKIGYPVLIKASAGGGGRGIRLVRDPADFARELKLARAEAKSTFGNDALLIEKYIEIPRHLEVQIMGDSHGNLVHLFERDCSVQRNNQKILEEAPAPNLPEAVRQKLFETALMLGREIGYKSAGTVEFIMAAEDDQPYFLEMNTRLQVEHPVTEMITGLDLVEWQLLVAAGLPLPLAQEEIRQDGHAIEARLAAERPEDDFQPSIGTFVQVEVPSTIRFDTGVATGSDVTPYYDSMLAKFISHGKDRAAALAALSRGLAQSALLGVGTNQAFLLDCLAKPDFQDGRATTAFLAQNFPDGWKVEKSHITELRALAAALWLSEPSSSSPTLWQRKSGFRVMGARRPGSCLIDLVDSQGEEVIFLQFGNGPAVARVGDQSVDLGDILTADEKTFRDAPVRWVTEGNILHVSWNGQSLRATFALSVDAQPQTFEHLSKPNDLSAPMPGLITEILVSVGDTVTEGDPILQMEAMKLVHSLRAGRSGSVASIHCKVGDTVPLGKSLIEIEIPMET
ncbi:biotin carboxylase N-terminal domain-containing protein [Sneathiella sp.]|uniref:acetyl/propionyl/methylcrotonyl-CoA carboxylase subunit alpha n=1 Tax=Sneathiella sp. TaxID=1964365 RepID=UPI003565C929